MSQLTTGIIALNMSKKCHKLRLLGPQPGQYKAVSGLDRKQSNSRTCADNGEQVKSLNYSKPLCVFSLTVFTLAHKDLFN